MRRTEYQSDDKAQWRQIVTEAAVGYLGMITPDGWPRVVPMNFAAAVDRTIYFHGAAEGEKFTVLQESPKVTFSIDLAYSVIPSYWISKKNAGGATMYYKSALVKGRCVIVEDIDEKVAALKLLMEKYQNDGGYQDITADSKTYRGLLKATAIFRIDPEDIDIKINFRQKKSLDFHRKIIKNLTDRGTPLDLKTAEEIKKLIKI